ncbi:MAG TPA: ribosome maturation factor RimM [Casimicrobiaceae bacterium]|nr:ribosome maturation factor RimM [Casimicrobiaceae bacterium]
MGRLGAPFGVRGWIKVETFTAKPDALLEYETWWIVDEAPKSFRLFEGCLHAGGVIAKFEGIETREEAARLRGSEIAVPREALPQIDEDEVYLADLVGLDVVNQRGDALGSVASVSDSAAQALLRVVSTQGRELLIPVAPAIVGEVDLEARRIVVDWEADY